MIIALIALVAIVLVYISISTDEEQIDNDIVTDKEFEKRFIYLVSRIDRGNINWTINALRQMKDGCRHYRDNDRALSILRVLEAGVENKDKTVIEYIKSCYLFM